MEEHGRLILHVDPELQLSVPALSGAAPATGGWRLAAGDAALQHIARVGSDVVALVEALCWLATLDGSAGLNSFGRHEPIHGGRRTARRVGSERESAAVGSD
ncbi:hypothetical protein ACVCIC_00955 [Burkholderia glumae]